LDRVPGKVTRNWRWGFGEIFLPEETHRAARPRQTLGEAGVGPLGARGGVAWCRPRNQEACCVNCGLWCCHCSTECNEGVPPPGADGKPRAMAGNWRTRSTWQEEVEARAVARARLGSLSCQGPLLHRSLHTCILLQGPAPSSSPSPLWFGFCHLAKGAAGAF
jgi:hypothetical protein